MTIKYEFTNKPWQSNGPGGWYFVSLPESISNEIRLIFKNEEEGWGRLKVTAKVGTSEWKTSIWFDTKIKTFLLPLKVAIRQKEKIKVDHYITVSLWI